MVIHNGMDPFEWRLVAVIWIALMLLFVRSFQ
jgi:hypothetical protein